MFFLECIGVFVGSFLFISVLQFIFNIIHKPYYKIDAIDSDSCYITVYFYFRGRTGDGSYMEHKFIKKKKKLKYIIDKVYSAVWIILYIVFELFWVVQVLLAKMSIEEFIYISIMCLMGLLAVFVSTPIFAFLYIKGKRLA